MKNASITHFKFVESRPRDNKILYKNKKKLSIIVWNGSYCPIQNNILKKQNTFWETLSIFLKNNYYLTNSIKKRVWIVYNFSAFLYANVPAESLSYAPTFFAALHRQWWRLHMSGKILEQNKKTQTNKTNTFMDSISWSFFVNKMHSFCLFQENILYKSDGINQSTCEITSDSSVSLLMCLLVFCLYLTNVTS